MHLPTSSRFVRRIGWLTAALAVAAVLGLPAGAMGQTCTRTLTAEVVAFDQVFFWNRLGAVQPQGMMYALKRDVVPISGTVLSPGNVKLRSDKRPRPIVLRMNVGDCLRIEFQNFLASTRRDQDQSATRWASIHVVGMQLNLINIDDGSYVGRNPTGLANIAQKVIYQLYAEREGEHVLRSMGAPAGGEGDGGQVNAGLFGAVIVEPAGSRWYRSQTTRQDLDYATTGYTATGQRILNYEALYPVGHPRAGTPVLNMLQNNRIMHSDLTAIIAGPQSNYEFASTAFPANIYTYPRRFEPFREFTIIYHDEIGAVQAFPVFNQTQFKHTLHSVRDGFAFNYGTGGAGAEIFANRIGVGPMWNCPECKYEEFFLTSWAVGDPAMVVDVPASSPCTVSDVRNGTNCAPTPGPKATKAFYPDDPSNVYHSYLQDHTKFRVLHAGSKEHHIHHLHAHQWLFSPDSDKSSYLDSQALGPGSSFTTEIAYEGSGNLNLTPGDSIFHCHFYPHFAQGMWALWRVHDVFEEGTQLDANGRPAPGSRALPDGEIAAGTPIPAVVPLPNQPMAPRPGATVSIVSGQVQVAGTGNPGYPFFVPGKAGHRPPNPPLDTIDDGGLPRHIITAGTFVEAHTPLDFHKKLLTATAQPIPETGTATEVAAMNFHATRQHSTCLPNGTCDGTTAVKFITNGRPAVRGAPIADPCIDANGTPIPLSRTIKGAAIETDVVINKKGWHFPQMRFESLWEDVADYITPAVAPPKPPEPLFMRANSGDCIEYWFSNLVPHEYMLDDFQVRTPTDILGQHIHLVKFDVLASDGSGNGFNYEDGSLSPGEVRERIDAIRAQNGCAAADPRNGTFTCPLAEKHPFFGEGPDRDGDGEGDWIGAQTTVQRWYADPVRDNAGNDRTLRTVFTHDHFGPSTHQQAGLYSGLVIEPAGSYWYHNETSEILGTRHDGGPTSWQAVIEPRNQPSYREFMIEFADFQLAYEEDSNKCRFDPGFGGFRCDDPAKAVNPAGHEDVGIPKLLARPDVCPNGNLPPCPEAISAAEVGTMTVNYRQEPVALRVRDPFTNGQAAGQQGDLSFAFSSIKRADDTLNGQPSFYQPLTADLNDFDPYTPMLRAYENDRVQIRILVGAHEEGHNFNIHGIKWLFEPAEPNSGYKNSQMMGISEHYEFIVPQLIKNPQGAYVDRMWSAGSSTDDLWNGMWGLFRAYTGTRRDLRPLPENPNGRSGIDPGAIGAFDFSCPKNAPVRLLDVTAVTAANALPGGRLVYNSRTDGAIGPLFDPTAILFVRTSDLDASGRLLPAVPVEPLVLRARAGECIKLTLRNRLPATPFDLNTFNTLPMTVEGFNENEIKPSTTVGLHPQLVYYDVSRYDGANVGGNANQTAGPGQSVTYEWYAGDVTINNDGTITATPIEFGATNLIPADRIEQPGKGAIGSLIIEPEGATWTELATSRAVADVINPFAYPGQQASFREFVVQFQNDVNMRTDVEITPLCGNPTGGVVPGYGAPIENLDCGDDAEDSGAKALNYRSEPLWKRMQYGPGRRLPTTDDFTTWYNVLSNSKVGGDPQTPVFSVSRGTPIRFRLLQSGGHSRNIVFDLHGHIWDKEPYIENSTRIGTNGFSMWEGARMGIGPTNHFDAVIRNGAGGKFSIIGDYLFRNHVATDFDGGIWGLLRVE
ncbi:MAG TPA: copper oxidase [Thermoanaerobaculia bacterium]